MEKTETVGEQVLLGSLLGDGSISYQCNNFYYQETHCLKQKNYLLMKTALWSFETKYNEYTRCDKKQRKDGSYRGFYRECYARSKACPQLKKYWRLKYEDKSGLFKILKKLDTLGLLIWYLDDGDYNYANKRISISRKIESMGQYNVIERWFRKKYGVLPRLVKRKTYFSFSPDDSKKLLTQFKTYASRIPESMLYKLGKSKKRATQAKRQRFRSHQQWRLQNPHRKKECAKRYYQRHRERLCAEKRVYYQEHRNQIRKYQKSYYQKHREELCARKRLYRRAHKEEINLRKRAYYHTHKK